MSESTIKKEIAIVSGEDLKDKIYEVRGVKVMLDNDLAEIYGYKTYKLNEQVRNNYEKFKGDDFMFQLNKQEFDDLISKKRISSWGGIRKLPYAFTEQGIYMLMTVLRGDLAIRQSRALVRIFKQMKDYIIENQRLMITRADYLSLSRKVDNNTDDIRDIRSTLKDVVTHKDLTEFMKVFDQGIESEEVLILNGEPFKADLAYQRIYSEARESIVVIDDYIGPKTLQHLSRSREAIDITVISDNKGIGLRRSEYEDYIKENPKHPVMFIRSEGIVHDRYIVLDYDTEEIKAYLCGGSSKDAGKRITTIIGISDVSKIGEMMGTLLKNKELNLK